ncbi:MAG: hypothetical protein AB1758_05205 [Candidatus Eremiobacterota bacterium]
MEKTCVMIGYRSDHALGVLQDRLQERSQVRVAFLDLDLFPRGQPFHLVSGAICEGAFYPPGEKSVPFGDVVSLCLPGLAVSPEAGVGFGPEDAEYISVECWASLIAIASVLSQHALVANFVEQRDHLLSRFSRLAFMSRWGVPVPRQLACTCPESALEFRADVARPLVFQAPAGSEPPCALLDQHLERLDCIRHAPVQFEPGCDEDSRAWLAVVGERAFSCPVGAPGPDSRVQNACVQAASALGIRLGEVRFRRTLDGDWVAHDLHPFLTSGVLAVPAVREAALSMLEGGLAA